MKKPTMAAPPVTPMAKGMKPVKGFPPVKPVKGSKSLPAFMKKPKGK